MGGRDYMFPLLRDPEIMTRVHETRDFFLQLRASRVGGCSDAMDDSLLGKYLDSFEERARANSERMCDDCTFTVTHGSTVPNPHRETRRSRQKEDETTSLDFHLQDPGPDQLCIECENAWLDELEYGWDLYCERRIACIGLGIARDKPHASGVWRRLPGGKYICSGDYIPGYTAILGYTSREEYDLRGNVLASWEIIERKTGMGFIARHKEFQEKHGKSYVRKELLRDEIRILIAEHVLEDGTRSAHWESGSAERSGLVRSEIRSEFVAKTTARYGEDVLSQISPRDIEHYCIEVEAGDDEAYAWYSVLGKYDFDQATDSCLYFIKQGQATKIGITNSLSSRFAQIKTSAAFPCEIENVVYTHFGYSLEQKLHRRLSQFNSHLEWFVLPPEIEERLFKAKSLDDIENFLKWLGENC